MDKDSRNNILLVANWESDVGYAWWLMENFWTCIASHFSPSQQQCYLIYPKITTLPDSIADSTIIASEFCFANHSLRNVLALGRFIRRHGIRYLYLSDAKKYSLIYLLLRLFGIRKIVVHDHTPGDRTVPRGLKKIVKSWLHNIPLYSADHFIAVSDFVRRRHIEVNRIDSSKCSVARNGIRPIDRDAADLRYAHRAFQIDDNRIIVVTTGRASYYKGIDFFIQCADRLINHEGLKQLHFLFVGDGPDLDAFKALCHEYDLDDHFTFAGRRADVREILPSCDIGFHTTHGEVGYSLSILETMSAGLATLVPDLLSTSAATIDRQTGLIYRHEDIGSACDAISACISDEPRQKIAQNAAKTVTINYNIDDTNRMLTAILDKHFRP